MDDLEALREKRKAELMQQAQMREHQQKQMDRVNEQKEQVLEVILDNEAKLYFQQIKQTKPQTARQIEHAVFILAHSGHLRSQLDKLTIKFLERKIEKKEGSITVQRKGEDPVTFSTSE